MDKNKAKSETNYRIAKMLVHNLFENQLLTDEEKQAVMIKLIDEFQPMIGELERGEYDGKNSPTN